jgi:hypothetical protein
MCITASRARLSDTLVYSGEGRMKGKDVHVLAYQNSADSDEPNAMILPFPTTAAMGPENIIDTRSFKGFLKDITNATKIHTKSLGSDRRMRSASFGVAAAQVFDVGSYTVVLAEHVSQIPEALLRVPESKRPEISTRFLIGYGQLYPKQPVAVCCWSGNIKAEPLLWWYEPSNKEQLFVPTMDAHDGNAPDVNANVDADHIVSVGSYSDDRIGHHYRVNYKESIPDDVRSLLPSYVYATKLDGVYKNGDMFANANKLGAGSKAYRDIPRIVRAGHEFEMYGWT